MLRPRTWLMAFTLAALAGCNCDPGGGGDAGGGGTGATGGGGGGATGGGAGGGGAAMATLCGNDGGVTWFGPSHYLSRQDSPFPCGTASEFHFDDFEDHVIDLPGVSLNAVLASIQYPSVIDSVDGDDGALDGTCHKTDGGLCESLFASGNPGITLSFDAGALPTFVGLVWTDGAGELSFEAFDRDGGRLGGIGPSSDANPDGGFPDGFITGTTAEDRFFGVVWPGGISRVRMSNSSGGIEIDHVQYGR